MTTQTLFDVDDKVVVEDTFIAYVVSDDGGPDVEVMTRRDREDGTGVTQSHPREDVVLESEVFG